MHPRRSYGSPTRSGAGPAPSGNRGSLGSRLSCYGTANCLLWENASAVKQRGTACVSTADVLGSVDQWSSECYLHLLFRGRSRTLPVLDPVLWGCTYREMPSAIELFPSAEGEGSPMNEQMLYRSYLLWLSPRPIIYFFCNSLLTLIFACDSSVQHTYTFGIRAVSFSTFTLPIVRV